MTRETKIGLIVATSFLGLVGVVVAARLSRNEEKSAADPSAVARINPLKNGKPESSTAEKGPKKTPSATGQEPGRLPILTAGNTGEPKLNVPPDLQNVQDSLANLKPVNPEKPLISPTPPSILDQEHQNKLNELAAQMKKNLPSPGPLPGVDPKRSSEPPLNVASNDNRPALPPLTSSPPPLVEPAPGLKPDLPPPVVAPAPSPTPPVSPSPINPKITEAPAPGTSTPVPAELAANSGRNAPAPGIIPKSQGTPPPPSPSPSPVTPPLSGAPTPVGSEPPLPPVSSPPPGPGTSPGLSPVNIGATKPGTPEPKMVDSVPPIGVKPMSSSPPITINPNPANGPQVKSYDVERYVTKPEDSTFAGISQKIYGTDKYAKALATFNKEYPLAAEALRQDSAKLQPGQGVFCPPVHVLESKYPWAVGESANPGGGNSGSPAITIGRPDPLVASVGNPNAMSTPPPGMRVPQTNGTNPDNTRNYTVREGGEHILEIARSVLRSSSRWIEVYRLNPSVRPEYPIPAGTVLKLPAS